MTTKEIAELTGKSVRRVQEWAQKTGAEIASISAKIASIKRNAPSDFTLDETIAILRTGGISESLISLLIENAQRIDINKSRTGGNMLVFLQGILDEMRSQDSRISDLESKVNKVIGNNQVTMLPPPQKTNRAALNQIVRSYADTMKIEFSNAWGMLYTECYYRLHINFKTRAKSENIGIIDFIEREGYIEEVYSIARDIFRLDKITY
jgi:hypothetical protein